MDTKIDLDELERLANAATPGPWVGRGNYIFCANKKRLAYVEAERALDVQTAAYIVAACNAVPELIAENRALKEKVRELERQKRVLVEKMAIDILCSECPVSEACPYENATFIDLEDCAKQLEKWSENAAKEAGEDAAIVG